MDYYHMGSPKSWKTKNESSINYTWVPIREQLTPYSTHWLRLALVAHIALIKPFQIALSWALSQNVWPSLVAWKCPPPVVDMEATSSMYPFWIDVGGLPQPFLPSGNSLWKICLGSLLGSMRAKWSSHRIRCRLIVCVMDNMSQRCKISALWILSSMLTPT